MKRIKKKIGLTFCHVAFLEHQHVENSISMPPADLNPKTVHWASAQH